ncbi:MAG: hypothetical protein FJ095_18730, partial [Deltaproteobacteria bacterium]|nr:hypothetical protein [Deltaproteobacteria bacterium]
MSIARRSSGIALSILVLAFPVACNKTESEALKPDGVAPAETATAAKATSSVPPSWVGEWVSPTDGSVTLSVRAEGISFASAACKGELPLASLGCKTDDCSWGEAAPGSMTYAAASKELTVAGAGAPAAASKDGGKVTATVRVAPTKPNGKAWDIAGGKPDIGLCAESKGTKVCQPGGANTIPAGEAAVCQDAFDCIVELTLAGDLANLEVVDIDATSNDPVGAGACKVGATCQLGAARVTLTAGAKPAAGVCSPAGGTYVRVADVEARKAADRAKEEEKARLEAEAKVPQKYPAPCASVDASTHVPVKGAEDLCVPVQQGLLAVSLLKDDAVLKPLPSGTRSYDDTNEIAVLGGPSAPAKETSSLSAAERGAIGAKVRGAMYYKLERAWGSWNWNALAGKLSGTL